MKNKKSLKAFENIIFGLILVAVLIWAIGSGANEGQKLWENGSVVEGIAVRTNDQVQENVMKTERYYAAELQFEINGTAYTKPNQKFDADTFDRLDADDHDGRVTVEVHYEKTDKEPKYVFYGEMLPGGKVIGK